MFGNFPRRHVGQIARGACYTQPPGSGKHCLVVAMASWVRITNGNRALAIGFT